MLAVHPSLPVKNLPELIALAKAQLGKLNYATSGLGSSNHMAGELFKMMAKVNIEHVPYKGNAPSIVDTVGGHVEMIFSGIPAVLPHAQSGRLRPIAMSTLKRAAAMPNVPTFDEQGLKGYESTNWFGIFAAARTPKDIVARLNTEIDRVIKAPDMSERFIERRTRDSGRLARVVRELRAGGDREVCESHSGGGDQRSSESTEQFLKGSSPTLCCRRSLEKRTFADFAERS